MQLTCPGCGARYHIDASAWPIDNGVMGESTFRARRVRCKVCGTLWAAVPEEEVLELDDPLPPFEEPRPAEVAWSGMGAGRGAELETTTASRGPKPNFTPKLEQPAPVFRSSTFAPAADAEAPSLQPSRKPAIRFEAPPVPARPIEPQRPVEQSGPSIRLPGPRALSAATIDNSPADEDEPWDEADDEPEADLAPRSFLWPAIAVAALMLGAGVYYAYATDQLPKSAVSMPAVSMPQVDMPAVSLPAVKLPAVSIPEVNLPRAAPSPLALEGNATRSELPDGRVIWEIKGAVHNPTTTDQDVPPVEVQMITADNKIVSRWSIRAEKRRLEPKGQTTFETSVIDPPAGSAQARLLLKPPELGRL